MGESMKIPIPFVGWIETEDAEDAKEMLRKQIEIQQNEIMRLAQEVTNAYQKGWSDAITAATKRLRNEFDSKE
jgi:major membrane immunogen (membrane-anchored lipoprotein)